MKKLIVFNSLSAPILSLPHGCLSLGYKNQVTEFCQLEITPEAIIKIHRGWVAKYWENKTGSGFRHINWENHRDDFLQWWDEQTEGYWLSTYDPVQYSFFKQELGTNCISVNYVWDEDNRNHILASLVVAHIEYLDHGLLSKNFIDLEIANLPYIDRFNYYMIALQSLVPLRNTPLPCDFEFDVGLFFDQAQFIDKLSEIAPDADIDGITAYYQQWRSTFDKYFLQRRIVPTSGYQIDA